MSFTCPYREYAVEGGRISEWDKFAENNQWASNDSAYLDKGRVPVTCIAIYYCIDMQEEKVKNKLYMATWNLEYKEDFKKISLSWVEEHFAVESTDIKQLDTPEKEIIAAGGEILFLLNEEGLVCGVVGAFISSTGECELVKLGVQKEFMGKGYSHFLMRELIQWAKVRNFPFIELRSNTVLAGALALYKKYGFETTHLGPYPGYERCNIVMRANISI